MFKLLTALLLCLTLLGCGQKAAPPQQNQLFSKSTSDILRCYPLDGAVCRFLSYGNDLYFLEAQKNHTELRRYSSKQLVQTAAYILPNDSVTIQTFSNGLTCYDPEQKELIFLEEALQETTRISLPECTAPPYLNFSGDRIYYCTASGLVECDIVTGCHRLLRQMPTRKAALAACLENKQVIAYADSQGSTHYVSTADGAQLGISSQIIAACTIGSRDCLALRCGYNDCLYLGSTMLPLVPGMHFLGFLPSLHSVLVYEADGSLQLSIYDLNTGNLGASLTLPTTGTPIQAAASADGRIFLLVQEQEQPILYQWLVNSRPQPDTAVRLTPVYTKDAPDQKGLEQCRQKAAFLEEKYDIRFLFHTAAAQVTPKGCTLEAEHIPIVLLDTLARIEQTLQRFPTRFIQEIAQQTTICLVREIQKDGHSLPYLQNWQGRKRFLYIAASENADESMLRALSTMIDQQIIILCDAYDTWDALNPADFVYGKLPAEPYAFADAIASSSSEEDRASLLLAAMTHGNRELFTDAILQNKLRRMCTGIRFIYSPKQTTLPWEQYLWQPIA